MMSVDRETSLSIARHAGAADEGDGPSRRWRARRRRGDVARELGGSLTERLSASVVVDVNH